jgi:hypothetical protein
MENAERTAVQARLVFWRNTEAGMFFDPILLRFPHTLDTGYPNSFTAITFKRDGARNYESASSAPSCLCHYHCYFPAPLTTSLESSPPLILHLVTLCYIHYHHCLFNPSHDPD